MRLTEKLLQYIYSALDRSPQRVIAFRARSTSDGFRHVVADGVLRCYDGDALLFSVTLADHTLASLAALLGGQNGIDVVYTGDPDLMALSATLLVDDDLAQAASNGDCFWAYTSLLWSYLESLGVELAVAKAAIEEMLAQMSIQTAGGEWLDYWGVTHFGIARADGETDATYSARILVEIMRPRNNNKAIELALRERFGQPATVTDVDLWSGAAQVYSGANTHNGSLLHNAVTAKRSYGLFVVNMSFDLESGVDQLAFAQQVRDFIEAFRASGTHMDSLSLSGASLADVATAPSDSSTVAVAPALDDAATASTDDLGALFGLMDSLADAHPGQSEVLTEVVSYSTLHDGSRTYDGSINHNSSGSVATVMS